MRKWIYLVLILLLVFAPFAQSQPIKSIAVTEEDGSPIVYDPWQIKFGNGGVTDNGDGTVSIAAGGGTTDDDVTVNASAVDTTANFKDTGKITWTLTDGGAGGPDDVEATVVPYQQVVTVAKAAGDYTTIQAAINAITDATTTKRYVVRVMSGVYTEAVTMKDYVDIVGAGRTNTIISGTSGTVLTFPANKGTVSEVGINVDYGALGANSAAITSAGADSVLKDCDITVTKSSGDFLMHGLSITAGSFRMSDTYFTYSVTGATDVSDLVQSAVLQTGALTTIIMNNNELIVTSDDVGDHLVGFESDATVTGISLLANNVIDVDCGAACSSATGVYAYGTSTGAIFNQNRLTVNCNGSAYGFWIDSSSGGAVIDTRHNEIIVTSAGAALSAFVAVGDTWNSNFDKITAASGYTNNGTVAFASSTVDGAMTATAGFTGALTGNASTATALAANGANCNAGEIALGVDASGAVEGCYEPAAADISDLSANTDITADLEEEAHCSEHDSADVDCSGETIVFAAGSVDEDNLAASLVFDDGDLLDFGSNVTAGGEGIMLPAHATDCTTAIDEGQVCWEEDAKILYVGDGAAAVAVGPGAAVETNSLEVVTTGIADTEIPIGTAADTVVYSALSGEATMTNAGVVSVLAMEGTDFGTMTDTYVCNYDLAGTEVDCDMVTDGAGDCASGAVCLGDHTHSGYLSAETNNLETVMTDVAADEVPVGTAANTAVYKAIADCDGNGNALNYDTTGHAFSCKTLADADMPDNATVTGWTMGASVATTPAEGDNDTSLATTAYVIAETADILDGTDAFTDFNGADIIDSDNYNANSIDDEHMNTTWSIPLPVHSGKISGGLITAGAQIDGGEDVWVALFDASSTESMLWQFRYPDYCGGTPVANLTYSMASATANKVDLEVDVMAVADAQDPFTEAFDTTNEITGGTTVPESADQRDTVSITLTNNDSIAAGEMMVIRVNRDHDDADDTATGDLQLLEVEIECTR